jgi:hypothetical protein
MPLTDNVSKFSFFDKKPLCLQNGDLQYKCGDYCGLSEKNCYYASFKKKEMPFGHVMSEQDKDSRNIICSFSLENIFKYM